MQLAAACVLLVAALYVFRWAPGLAARKSHATTLPRLRAELADMRVGREEFSVLHKEIEASSRCGPALPRRSSASMGLRTAAS